MSGRPVWNRVLVGDARKQLATVPAGSVDTVVTSPPYFLLRDYQVDGQLGAEGHVDAWVQSVTGVLSSVERVLKPGGSVWLNVADSYSRHPRYGAPPKSLLLGPERLALALLDAGWTVRNRVAWVKRNPMPASVTDRLNCGWEFVYLLVRKRGYFFDLDAIRQPHRTIRTGPRPPIAPIGGRAPVPEWAGPLAGNQDGLIRIKAAGRAGHVLGKNPGDVLTTGSSNFRGAHFATFPKALVEPLITATCPERVCGGCGQPWICGPVRSLGALAVRGELAPSCRCQAGYQPGLVLDPFMGAGTVAVVAQDLGRRWLGCELNPAFAELSVERLGKAQQAAA